MFQIVDISKKYEGEFAIKKLTMEIGLGLNFIIGASGSGKTTLLKILGALDNNYTGDVFYLGKSIKNINDEERAYFYNNKFGFVWQDFNLIEDMSVEENIMLPLHIKKEVDKNEIQRIIKKLDLYKLKDKKVKFLSGGQKQRVAIARELAKNPEVIIADEPTSALDRKMGKEVIEILKDISKERTVIIVTHDKSLIDNDANIYEIDKGELISISENANKDVHKDLEKSKRKNLSKFNFARALKLGEINCKSNFKRSVTTIATSLVAAILITISLGGGINESGSGEFDTLINKYGKQILNINIVKSFMSASNMDGETPQGDVDQNIDGLYEKYGKDERVDYVLFEKAINDVNIKVDGNSYSVMESGSVPMINEVIEGKIPENKGEILVPESFVKKLGISNKDAIGKEVDFSGSIFKWEGENPIPKEIGAKLKIVGIADTTLTQEIEGQKFEMELEDSFFFDKETLSKFYSQAGISETDYNFVIKTKNPSALIEIKNELNAKGIVPLGAFELVEDIVKLSDQSSNLSKGSNMLIGTLGVLGVLTISVITALMRKREYGIYKITGYSKKQLALVLLAESIIFSMIAAVALVVLSPVVAKGMILVLGINILSLKNIIIGVVATFILGVIVYITSTIIGKNVNPLIVLKAGGK
ncbi:MAG: ATP-binding cassette domain-containing protein [Sarcina sp.]